MRAYRSAVAAMLVSLLVGGAPVLAQESPTSVTFDGIGFSFDGSLGTSVSIAQVPGQPTDVDLPAGPEVPHLAFTPYAPQSEATKVPRASDAPGVVRFYRTGDLAGNAEASAQLEAMQTLMSERPDLAASMEVAPDGSAETLPYLPVVPAAQVIRSRAHYVDTPALAGVAYLTVFRQDASPFASGDFWYTFQGLSADGAWYVAADFAIDADMFPAKVTAEQAERVAEPASYTAYLGDSSQRLNDAAPDAFDPSLTSIDALVRSIVFDDAPTSGQG
jgi:hypothetical protein